MTTRRALLALYHTACAAVSLAAIALLALRLAAPLLLEQRKPEIEANIAAVFGGATASIGDISVEANASGVFLRVDDVSVVDGSSGESLLAAQRVLAELSTGLLADSPDAPLRVALIGPRLTVAREADGSFSVAGLRPRPGMVSAEWGALAGAHYALREAEITLLDRTGAYPELLLSNFLLNATHRPGEFVIAMQADSPNFTGAVLHARIDDRTIGSPAEWEGGFRIGLDTPSATLGGLRWSNGSLRATAEGTIRDGRIRADLQGTLENSELAMGEGGYSAGSGRFSGTLELSLAPSSAGEGPEAPTADLSVAVDLADVRVDAPAVMHHPVDLSGLSGVVSLAGTADDWHAHIENGRAESPLASAVFRLSAAGDSSEAHDIRLSVRSDRPVDARDTRLLLPTTVDTDVSLWLDTAIRRGSITAVEARMRGHPLDFPYASGESGEFRLAFAFEDADFDYWPGWPGISGAKGTLLFVDKRMGCVIEEGRIGDVDISGSAVTVPDLLVFDERVHVSLAGRSASEALLAGLQELPPLAGRDLASAVELSGESSVTVDIEIPIRHADDTVVAGTVTLAGNRARLPGQDFVGGAPLELTETDATVGFDKEDITVSGNGRLLGKRARVEASLGGDRWSGSLQTRVRVEEWLEELGSPGLAGIIDGETMVAIRKSSDAPLSLSSELIGVRVALPHPLGKGRTERLPLSVVLGERTAEIGYGDGLVRALVPVGEAGGGIRVGINRAAPDADGAEGVALAGRASQADLDEWLALLGDAEGGDGTGIRATLELEDAVLLGRENSFARIGVESSADGSLRVSIDAEHVSGTVSAGPDQQGEPLIRADFEHIGIGKKDDGEDEGDDGQPDRVPGNFPRLPQIVLAAAKVEVGNRSFEKVTLEGGPRGAVWALERLESENAGHRLTASGSSTMEGVPHSQVTFGMQIEDAPGFIESWGGDTSAIIGGVASIEGDVAWGDSLLEPDPRTMGGSARLGANATRIMKSDTGFLKLLQLITPDLFLNLGFTETLQEGILFDTIEGSFSIERGVLSTEDFVASSPDLTVGLSGSTDLEEETLDFRGRIRPGVAAVNAVIGVSLLTATPATALLGWLAQKIFEEPINAIKEPFADVGSYEYTVRGTWDEPEYEEVRGDGGDAEDAPRPADSPAEGAGDAQ